MARRRAMRGPAVVSFAAALALGAHAALAADAASGKARAQPCAVCHGALGLSSVPDAPNLAGQPAIYVAAQLRAFRSADFREGIESFLEKRAPKFGRNS